MASIPVGTQISFLFCPTLVTNEHFTFINVYVFVYMVVGINSFQMNGQDYIVSGCEDRSFNILDMHTGMVFAIFSASIPLECHHQHLSVQFTLRIEELAVLKQRGFRKLETRVVRH